MSSTCPTCAEDFRNENGMKVHHKAAHGESLAKTVTLACEWCGEMYEAHPNQAEESRFCSNGCQMRERHGDDIHAPSPRSEALERDGWVCQRCNAAVGYQATSSRTAEVHHIIPRSAGGPNSAANLVTLCRDCHVDVHNSMREWDTTHPDLLEKLREAVCNDHGRIGEE